MKSNSCDVKKNVLLAKDLTLIRAKRRVKSLLSGLGCWRCGNLGHKANSCESESECSLCGEKGHTFFSCPRSFANKAKGFAQREDTASLPKNIMSCLKISTWNARGIQSKSFRSTKLKYLLDTDFDILCVQELRPIMTPLMCVICGKKDKV
uniref:CCHC-type domain-containing protein n=1 Tax=Sander lucioperca TaxID=283035 RepID=A0A8C9Z8M4_SANLU